MPWATPEACDEGVQRRRLEAEDRSWGRDGVEASYVVVDRADGQVVGGCGIQPRPDPSCRAIGYWLRTDRTGRGLATDASATLVGAALALPGVSRVELRCDEANVRSAAIARRLGFALVRTEPHPIDAPAQTGTSQVWSTRRAR
jgi:RimJ/RimL family protein N-acetyltransferase